MFSGQSMGNGGKNSMKGSACSVAIQRWVLSMLELKSVLIAVPKTVFIPMCTPLLVIYFGMSVQIVSSDLRFCRRGGGKEVAQEREGG